jgi:hypothetical protein
LEPLHGIGPDGQPGSDLAQFLRLSLGFVLRLESVIAGLLCLLA